MTHLLASATVGVWFSCLALAEPLGGTGALGILAAAVFYLVRRGAVSQDRHAKLQRDSIDAQNSQTEAIKGLTGELKSRPCVAGQKEA